MALLTEQQKEFYFSMEETFRTKGWSLITTGWKNEQKSIEEGALFGATDPVKIGEARERWKLLAELIMLPKTIEAQKQAILDDEGMEHDPYV